MNRRPELLLDFIGVCTRPFPASLPAKERIIGSQIVKLLALDLEPCNPTRGATGIGSERRRALRAYKCKRSGSERRNVSCNARNASLCRDVKWLWANQGVSLRVIEFGDVFGADSGLLASCFG